ncbi:hypothetical protein BWI15_02700 [Kribbella sp. ALI-6-A]|uniref:hypothetical protein n=1 Tax=Kribbella sp. ALI-6-A TaxID=1933817 RepID=UPI00097C1A86|nr:hypothetical protein [Kribbella sp. ALI-6-A]ONI77442.1 hypothetical protein BWI15_02700 [Kribbella sp. ALI-6-A]
MDDVKRLLEQFADRTADGLPPADVDADVARGRRALRRIKARRRVTGVLCVAAATTAVLVAGDQTQWWGGGETEVATDATTPPPKPSAATAGSAAPSTATDGGKVTTFSKAGVQLVSNPEPWNSIACTLSPRGWTASPRTDGKRVVLTPPSARTAEAAAQLELFAADAPQSLSGVRAVESGGKVFHLGNVDGRAVGQVELGGSWLIARLPIEHQDWNDDLVRRFLDSCTVS